MDFLNNNNRKRLRTSSSSSIFPSLIFNHQPSHNNSSNCSNNYNNSNNNSNNIIINQLKNQIIKLEIENQNIVKEKFQLENEIETIRKDNLQLLISGVEKDTQINQLLLDVENLKNETNQLLYISYQQNEQLSSTIDIFKKENDNLITVNQQLKQDLGALTTSYNQFLEINESLKKSESEKHDKILMLELKLDYLKNQYCGGNGNGSGLKLQHHQLYHNQHHQPNFDNEFKLYQDTIKLKENIQFLKELVIKKDKEVKELKSAGNYSEKLELSNSVINHLFDEISKLKQINLNDIKTIVFSLINGNEYDVFGSEFKNCNSSANHLMKSKLTKHFKELSLLVHPDKCNVLPYHLFSKLNTYYDNLKKLYNNNNNNQNTVY